MALRNVPTRTENQLSKATLPEHLDELGNAFISFVETVYIELPLAVYRDICSLVPPPPPSWRVGATTWVMASAFNRQEHAARCSAVKKMIDAGPNLTLDHPGGISSLPPTFPAKVTSLNVSGNKLRALHQNLPSKLEVLNASHNKLRTTPSYLPTLSLRVLDLSHNKLKAFPVKLLYRGHGLEHINLSHNRITEITEKDAWAIRQMGSNGVCIIDLTDNPLSYTALNRLYALGNDNGGIRSELRYTKAHNGRAENITIPAKNVPQPQHNSQPLLALKSPPAASPSNPPPAATPGTHTVESIIERAIQMGIIEPEVDMLPRPDTSQNDALVMEELQRFINAPIDLANIPHFTERLEELGTSETYSDTPTFDASQVLELKTLVQDILTIPDTPAEAIEMANSLLALIETIEGYGRLAMELEAQGNAFEPEPPPASSAELGQTAAAWASPHSPTGIAATTRRWQGFADEPGAPQFTHFLKRLHNTVNANQSAFQQGVATWLTQLESNPTLRADTFAIAIDASNTCQDRISWTYNNMRKLSMAADVSRGKYDQRLPDLINLARGMFRLEQLEQIARETTATLIQENGEKKVDEIEVYLGYQVMLRDRLALPVETINMATPRLSDLTQTQLNNAHKRVFRAEKRKFFNYLALDFAPWQEAMQRLDPKLYQEAQEELIDAMGEEFSYRLISRLFRERLLDNEDAERTYGAELRTEIAEEVYGQLTRDFLTNKGMLHLLN